MSYKRTASRVKKKLRKSGGAWLLIDRGPNTGTEDRPVYASQVTTTIYGVRDVSTTRSPEGLIVSHNETLLVAHDAVVSIGDVLTKGGVEFKVDDIEFTRPGEVIIMQTLIMAA